MKNGFMLLSVSLLMLFSFQILPQEIANQNISAKEACIKTLLGGLSSDNHGLQAGCTFMLGELCCDRSVILLLDALHNNPSEGLRILAALSLYKIGDSRGLFAIKQAIKFDESDRVRRLCEKFYRVYMKEVFNSRVEVAVK
jgi:hypothetical protein